MTIMFEVSLHFWQIRPFVWRQHNKPKASSKKPTLIKCKWYSAQIEQPREKRKVLTAQIVLPCMIRPVAHTHTAHHHTHYYRVVVYRKSCQQLLFRTSHISLDAYFSLLLSARAPGLKFRSGGTVLKFVWNKNWICPELVFTWVKAIKVICNSFLCYSLLQPPFLPCFAPKVWILVEHFGTVAICPNQYVAKNLWKYSYFTWCIVSVATLCCHHPFCPA